jgi:hypothetical protein
MAIVYYPNRVAKRLGTAIDRVMAKRSVQTIRGAVDITSSGANVVISCNSDWQLNSIKLNFSAATARDYGWKVISGRKIVTGMNDYLWFQMNGTLWTRLTLSAGFYTGTQLAAELKSKLDTAFAPITFTVTYAAATGLFTITPSSGTLKYIQTCVAQTIRYRDSIAGHLFGLNATSSFGSTVVSDTPVFGLNTSADFVDETASVVLEHYNDDLHIFSIDQALNLVSGTAGIMVDYEVNYEEIV